MPHCNWEVPKKLFKPPSERFWIQPLVYITESKLKEKNRFKFSSLLAATCLQNAFLVLWHVWHEESRAIALFLSWAFSYADFSSYSITSWHNNAWQELIKNCNMNPCRAHWGKFVIGTVFLCLHEQKQGLTVSLISSFGSVWTHCWSAWLFLHFSLQQQQSLFSKRPLSECCQPGLGQVMLESSSNLVFCNSPCSAVLSNAEFIDRVWEGITDQN